MSIDNVGARIKALRKQKKYTLKDMSSKTGISVSFLSDIENGRSNPSLDRLTDIAKTLDINVSYLLGENILPLKSENTIEKSNNRNLYKELVVKIKEFREKSCLSTEMLAKLSGVPVEEIIGLENNTKEPSIDTILKLTYALTINLSEILKEFNDSKNLKPLQKQLIEESKNLTDEQIKRITELIKAMK